MKKSRQPKKLILLPKSDLRKIKGGNSEIVITEDLGII